MEELLRETAERAIRYRKEIGERQVFPSDQAVAALSAFDEPFPAEPGDPREVLRLLDEVGGPATVATTGPRYFGFVTGGVLPAAAAANWMAGTWDQNAALTTLSPTAAKLEAVALHWLIEALGLPEGIAAGFVTGATMANFTGLAAARHSLLERAGWDVEARGLFGAPEIRVVVGDEVHVSVLQALMMLGLGRECLTRVPADSQGRMRAEMLPSLDEHTILILQAGNVNSGAFDPVATLIEEAHKAGAWVHVDGAFGLWALASPALKHLAAGVEKADSIAADAHKWLNVSYDSGIVFCSHPDALRRSMMVVAPYLVQDAQRQPMHYVPEQSRRARGIEVWAALKSLGRSGLAGLFEGCCSHAARLAQGLKQAGYTVQNEVVLNQVFVSFGSDHQTDEVIRAVQHEGTLWAGRSEWQGHVGMRISVSSWATTGKDIDLVLEAILRAAKEVLNP